MTCVINNMTFAIKIKNLLFTFLIFFSYIQHLGSIMFQLLHKLLLVSVICNYLSRDFHIVASSTWAQECSRLALARPRTYTRRHARSTSTYDPFRRSCSVHHDPMGTRRAFIHTRIVDPVKISPVSHAPWKRIGWSIVYGNRRIIAVRISEVEILWKRTVSNVALWL